MGTVSIWTLAQSPSTTNMKFLVLFACVVAAASAQLVAYPNGAVAPAKTPEVQAAEAAHFAAKGLPWGAYGAYGLGHLGYAGHLGYGAGCWTFGICCRIRICWIPRICRLRICRIPMGSRCPRQRCRSTS